MGRNKKTSSHTIVLHQIVCVKFVCADDSFCGNCDIFVTAQYQLPCALYLWIGLTGPQAYGLCFRASALFLTTHEKGLLFATGSLKYPICTSVVGINLESLNVKKNVELGYFCIKIKTWIWIKMWRYVGRLEMQINTPCCPNYFKMW
jgi:hypothetical protein